MDKEYMLYSLRQRKAELERRYYLACRDKDQYEKPIAENTAKVLRARIKRDIQLLILIEQLLIGCSSMYIEDEDAIDGFHKLVEPVEKYKEPKEQVNGIGYMTIKAGIA